MKKMQFWKKNKAKIRNAYAGLTGIAISTMVCAAPAFADNNMLSKVQDLLSKAMMFGGGAIAI